MFKFNKITLLLSILMATTTSYANASGEYKIDPAHSKVGFSVTHLMISSVEGQFGEFSGTINFDEKSFKKSKVAAEVQTKSIDTSNSKRDDHLRSKDFFEVKKYPTMTFKSTKITGNKSKFKMTGNLTMKGITKKVTFTGKFIGAVKDGYGNMKAGFQASTKISRKAFGLSWSKMVEAGPVVGDEVTINLNIQAAKPLAKK